MALEEVHTITLTRSDDRYMDDSMKTFTFEHRAQAEAFAKAAGEAIEVKAARVNWDLIDYDAIWKRLPCR